MIDKDQMVITSNFSQDPKDIFGKIEIAPTVQAQQLWEMWKKNPTMFALAPGYIVKKQKDGVIEEAELIEVSLVVKYPEKQ